MNRRRAGEWIRWPEVGGPQQEKETSHHSKLPDIGSEYVLDEPNTKDRGTRKEMTKEEKREEGGYGC